MIIKPTDRLSNSDMMNFISNFTEDQPLNVYLEKKEEILETKVLDLKNFFKSDLLKNMVTEDEIIHLMAEEHLLTFTGKDYLYWTETLKDKAFGRLNRLFKKESKRKTKSSNEDVIYNFYSGIKKETGIDNIVSFRGNKKEALEFLNKQYSINEIKCNFTNKSVFCFEISIDKLENWKTINQLKEEGIIEF